MKKSRTKTIVGWVFFALFLVLSGVLIKMSLQSGEDSTETSVAVGGFFDRFLTQMFPDPTGQNRPISEWWEYYTLFIRKGIGHFGGFFTDGLFGALAAALLLPKRLGMQIWIPLCAGFLLASLTEILQSDLFNVGRSMSFGDVALDFCGFALSTGIVVFFVWLARNRKRKV